MATTTLAAIKNQWETLLDALTPGSRSDILFRRAPRDYDFRTWAEEYKTACNRTYQITRAGETTALPFQHPSEHWWAEEIRLEIAYFPPSFRGTQGLDDVEDIVRADALQVLDELTASDNLISGQDGIPDEEAIIGELDREGDVWFQEITFTVRYTETRS